MKKIKVLGATAVLIIAAVFLTATVYFSNHANAATTTEVISECDIVRQAEGTPPSNAWVLYTRNAGVGAFVPGPGDPPLSGGSLQLNTPGGSDKVWLFNYEHIGTPLSSIDAISYSTYRTAGSAQQVTALNIEIDRNGGALETGDYAVLVFEPVYNTSQGTVQNGVW